MKEIINISISTTNDNVACLVCVDAKVERKRELGAPFNVRNYEDITDASLRRLQRAQLKLLDYQR